MRHRRVVVGSGLAVAALALGMAAKPYLFDRGVTTPVGIDEAVDRYHAATTTASPASPPSAAPASAAPDTAAATTPPAPTDTPATDTPATDTPATIDPLPEPGVYVYTTTGGDAVDALNGDHHVYPATTTITVTTTACGTRARWDAAVERWQEWDRCAHPDGVELVGHTNFDQFFGQSQTDTFECSGEPRPLTAAAGAQWAYTCRQGDVVESVQGVVIGTERRTIDATPVESLHVQLTIDPGDTSDREVTDSWFVLGTDLLVAQTEHNATTEDSPVGDVHYTEDYTIELTSLVPVS